MNELDLRLPELDFDIDKDETIKARRSYAEYHLGHVRPGVLAVHRWNRMPDNTSAITLKEYKEWKEQPSAYGKITLRMANDMVVLIRS